MDISRIYIPHNRSCNFKGTIGSFLEKKITIIKRQEYDSGSMYNVIDFVSRFGYVVAPQGMELVSG